MDSSFQNGLTALAGGTQTGYGIPLITRTFTRFTTVATGGDSALLQSANGGLYYFVKNAGAQSMNVFPNPAIWAGNVQAGGDKINALGVNAAFALAAGKTVQFICYVDGTWDTLPTIP
jgi:hypothetical protein